MINGVPLNALKALAFKDKLVTTDINDIGQFCDHNCGWEDRRIDGR
jgi:hypothetical protein